jgi:hypothetical protein
MSRTRAIGGMVALAVVLIVAACGGADANYVSNTKAGLFLKIPTSWQQVDLQAGDVKPDGVLATPEAWRVGIDGSSDPKRQDFEDSAPTEPVGIIEVVPIDPTQISGGPSLAFLRSLLTGTTTDPSTGATITPAVKVLRDDEVNMSTGHWGVRTTVETENSDDPFRISQLALFDPGVHRLYRVTVGCTASCFDAHDQEIEAIFQSLTLRGTS